MSEKVDQIIYAAVQIVENMTPEERAIYANGFKPGVGTADPLFSALVRGVETSGLHPGDEVFTLLRRDPAAPDTIRFWAMKAASLARGVSNAPKCDAARRLAESWAEWQRDNLTKVKVPD